MGSVETPEIILYTNHRCPWAHRAHIALAELNLPFKEVIIDLSVPRTAEYLGKLIHIHKLVLIVFLFESSEDFRASIFFRDELQVSTHSTCTDSFFKEVKNLMC
jgi:Glutathione S-transferase, N-terminal domain